MSMLPALQSLNQPWGYTQDPNTIGAGSMIPTIAPDGSVSWAAPVTGAGPAVPGLQTISGYQPWGSGVPAGAGFGTKLGNWFSSNGKMIGGIANLASQGINAYLGLQQLGMAKDALAFEKKSFKTNLANAVQSYNTQTQDRINGRFYATEEERQAALKAAELPQGMRG